MVARMATKGGRTPTYRGRPLKGPCLVLVIE